VALVLIPGFWAGFNPGIAKMTNPDFRVILVKIA
jgi:hypothetical protein